MIKIDLITGFLGSGKTTFLKQYAKYLMAQGKNIGILENDFGAVNVDMLLLQELRGRSVRAGDDFRRMRQRDTPQTVPHETDLDGHGAATTAFSWNRRGFTMWMSSLTRCTTSR